MTDLAETHGRTKAVRQRGEPVQNALATEQYFRALEDELDQAWRNLMEAREMFDRNRSFVKCVAHLDKAQQRLHQAVRRMKKKGKKS